MVYPDYRLLPEKTYSGKEINLPALFVLFPFWFFSGTLVVGWLTYFAALAISALQNGNRHPLTIANAVVMTAGLAFIIIITVINKKKNRRTAEVRPLQYKDYLCTGFFILLFFFVTYLTCRSFNIVQNTLRVGYSVFSDFAVHLGMIRSFSFGNNFPTQYSHFAGEDIRYHFMFEFLAGNLEYLGLPIDHAFNFPSILSFMSMSMLLFSFTLKLCGSRLAGVISTLMMVFRSSPSLFRYLGSLNKGGVTKEEFLNRDYFFSYTPKEDWGLWNFKVYLNQRHLAFGIGVVLMALIIFAPLLYEGINDIRELFRKRKKPAGSSETDKSAALKSFVADHVLMSSLPRAVFCGVLLGICAFWNGAMVIGGLCVLFIMALMSSHRLEYLLTAVISVILSSLQTKIFIFGDVIAPEFLYGFIADIPTFWGSISYLLALSGALLILAAAYFVSGRGALRYFLLAFSAPLIFAFTVSLTPDVTVNHKYVMLAFILIGIPVAVMVTKLLESSRISRFISGLLLLVILTATGIYECRVVRNIDKDYLEFRQDSDLTKWVKENSTSKDIWLTDMISNHEIVLGGAMLYYGWPYYAWSAGYDTNAREEKTARMFSAPNEEELKRMIGEEGIRFIMTDDGLRYGDHYALNEDVIAAAYPLVYQSGDVKIYDTVEK
ncbi:MAG: hypothetical protein J6X66_06350 [Lachnospiraceae bacterium]|nr:hypothetical protein [Lachnospiraceae bacterium]